MQLLSVGLIGLLLSACTVLTPKIPSDLKTQGKSLSINWSTILGSQDPIRFGSFSTTGLDIDLEVTKEVGLTSNKTRIFRASGGKDYSFTLNKKASKTKVMVACSKVTNAIGITKGSTTISGGSTLLQCKIGSSGHFQAEESPTNTFLPFQVEGLPMGSITVKPLPAEQKLSSDSYMHLAYEIKLGQSTKAAIALKPEKKYYYIPQDPATDTTMAAIALAVLIYFQ